MREVLLFCAAAGRGTPLRGHHGQGVVCCAEDELRHGALGRVDAEFGGVAGEAVLRIGDMQLSLIHISEPTRRRDFLSSRPPARALPVRWSCPR